MKKKDLLIIASLMVVVLLIYYPLFFSEYAYTDELVQLWLYKNGSNYHMFLPLGRNITDLLFSQLFGSIDTIHGITRLRLFSLLGWICCIPVWYYILKGIIIREGLPEWLCSFTMIYLVCCPAFSVSVQWAACMELFIANTAGLVSGFIFFNGFQSQSNAKSHKMFAVIFSLLFGLISLFTYQNGFGCFFIPFIIHLIAQEKLTRLYCIAIAMSIFIFASYYIIFKWSLTFYQILSSERAGLATDPWHKLIFFFTRPMASAFHFTFLMNERNIVGSLFYAIVFASWTIFIFFQRLAGAIKNRLFFFTGLFGMLMLIYLPSLLVKENYSSNRTLLALDVAVCLLFFETFFSLISSSRKNLLLMIAIAVVFFANAWYNFTIQFLRPVKSEYQVLKSFLDDGYHKGIDTIYFIRPPENLFQQTRHITASWDEFGVPSLFFEWVPEFFVRQVVYEKTGNRRQSESLVIKSWPQKELFQKEALLLSNNILLIDAGTLLSQK